jgi:thioredoxin 1
MSGQGREIIELNITSFKELSQTSDVMVIDISAEWCGPCEAFTDLFRSTAAKYDDVVFASIDAEEQMELGAAFNVRSIPTVAVMRGGALIYLHEGTLSEAALAGVIRQARELDVDKVRQSVAARTSAS